MIAVAITYSLHLLLKDLQHNVKGSLHIRPEKEFTQIVTCLMHQTITAHVGCEGSTILFCLCACLPDTLYQPSAHPPSGLTHGLVDE